MLEKFIGSQIWKSHRKLLYGVWRVIWREFGLTKLHEHIWTTESRPNQNFPKFPN